jgi:hypothetical protein
MSRHLEENKVRFNRLLVDQPFAFADARDAYACLELGKLHGKIIIKMDWRLRYIEQSFICGSTAALCISG